MTNVKMSQFGSTLTDREDGKRAALSILERTPPPVQLDFAGVVALGSSFGEEVVRSIAKNQNDTVAIVNASNVVRNSLYRIAEGTSIHLSFEV
ncbi:MAG: hypothetical protein QGH42_07965 [Kiritimatiellia bacterium]|nr:hypothetical protein [Kiritimatiellia bacterium]MDP6810817.1 hypothetical protein [Kiritimatiellia bacterium]MDP7024159.1 hypothetical protein [Kiritimatiellia bacterium]